MARQKLTRLMHVIAGSASLRAREQTIIAGYTASLAHLIAEEVGVRDETEAWVVSGALLAVHRMLIDAARQQVLDGVDPTAIARAHTARADRALSLLADGLRGYAVRPSRSRARRTRR
jgi:hypothetical protein